MDNSAATEKPSDLSGGSADAGHAAAQETGRIAASAKKEVPRGKRLSRLAGIHALLVVASLAMFAAADSWSALTGFGLAALLSVVTAALAGVVIATLVHEWFHYVGARCADAKFGIPAQLGLFVFNWDFASNTVRQFLVMSIAGSIGGVLSVMLLCNAVPADSWGRAVLRSAAIASVIYAALIEWPVIRRIRSGGDPLTELSKIDKPLLSRSFIVAGISGIVLTLVFVP